MSESPLNRALGHVRWRWDRAAVQAAAAILGIGLVGCSGNGMGLDENGMPLTGNDSGNSGGAPLPLSADFASLQENVFTPICSVCHVGADAPQGLILDAQHSYSLLVGVPSTEVPSLLRVDPGNPGASYIVQKLEGTAAVGGQMPLGQPPLPASTIAFIKQWITDGAQPAAGAATAAAAAFTLAAAAPEDGALLAQPPAQLVMSFTRELDATSVNAQSIRLELAAQTLAAASPVSASPPLPGQTVGPASGAQTVIVTSALVPDADRRAVLLTPLAPLQPGRYRVVLSAQPGTQLTSLDGQLLPPVPLNDEGDRTAVAFSVGQ